MSSRQGWVSEPQERAAIEAAVSSALIGRELLAVRYVELDYAEPAWDCGRFHSIDYGVEFDLAAGATFAIIWQQQGWNETLLTYPGTIGAELRPEAEISIWDVSDVWRASLPGNVVSVEAVWTKHRWGPSFGGPRFETRLDDGHESDYCLTTLLLRASGESRALVTLGGDSNDGHRTFTYLADNVAVFFSLPEARDAGVLLPGDPEAIP